MKKLTRFFILFVLVFNICCGLAGKGYSSLAIGNFRYTPVNPDHIFLRPFLNSPYSNENCNGMLYLDKNCKNHSKVINEFFSNENYFRFYESINGFRCNKKVPSEEIYKATHRLINNINASYDLLLEKKAAILDKILNYKDNTNKIINYIINYDFKFFEKIYNIIYSHFLYPNDLNCKTCQKVFNIYKSLKDNPKELYNFSNLINKTTNSNYYVCPKCNIYSAIMNFVLSYNNMLSQIEKKKNKVRENIEILKSQKNNDNNFIKLQNNYKCLLKHQKNQLKNPNKFDNFFEILLNIPNMQKAILGLVRIPKEHELNSSNMNCTQLRNAYYHLKCEYCGSIFGKVHLLTIKKILKQNNKKFKFVDKLFKINKSFESNNGKVTLGFGNKNGETFYVNKCLCMSCFLESKIIEFNDLCSQPIN